MTISIDHFIHSCSFDCCFGDDDPFDTDWFPCTVSLQSARFSPFVMNLSVNGHSELSFAISPIYDKSFLFTDIDTDSTCSFNPFNSIEDIAEDIDFVIEDEEISSLVSHTIVSFCLPAMGITK